MPPLLERRMLMLAFAAMIGGCHRRVECERQADGERIFTYDNRLELREISNSADQAAGKPNSTWGDVRVALDDWLRAWSEMRMSACMDERVDVERCLDRQAEQVEGMIEGWLAGDRSWANLDERLPFPGSCW